MYPVKVLSLLLLVNSVPFLFIAAFPRAGKWPLDNNRIFMDGFRLLGRHKSIAGFVSGVLAGALGGVLLGIPVWAGLIAGFLSMTGDSFSSFLKRRLGAPEGTNLPVLDQVFESGIPLLFFHYLLPIGWLPTGGVLVSFVGIVCSVTGIRGKLFSPPKANSNLCVRSVNRFRQWRACHTALSPFSRLLNFENFLYYRWAMAGIFRGLGLYDRGLKNALDVRIKEITLTMPRLPAAFNSYRILFMSDLHIDGIEALSDRLIGLVRDVEVDLCLLGGDYRMLMYGSFIEANKKLKELVTHIHAPDGIFGILGNHDCIEIAPDLEDAGIYMLINDAQPIERDGVTIYLAGVDDVHYYKCHSLSDASKDIPENGFSILLSHSPEIIKEMGDYTFDLCLCGHTHGGQICLPGIGAVFTHVKIRREFVSGFWQFKGMTGYTTQGAGSSGVPVRFFCPPEVVILTLMKGGC
ncbi:MAG: CDP-archaeol synthase [Pseudomonadota bacterium]